MSSASGLPTNYNSSSGNIRPPPPQKKVYTSPAAGRNHKKLLFLFSARSKLSRSTDNLHEKIEEISMTDDGKKVKTKDPKKRRAKKTATTYAVTTTLVVSSLVCVCVVCCVRVCVASFFFFPCPLLSFHRRPRQIVKQVTPPRSGSAEGDLAASKKE